MAKGQFRSKEEIIAERQAKVDKAQALYDKYQAKADRQKAILDKHIKALEASKNRAERISSPRIGQKDFKAAMNEAGLSYAEIIAMINEKKASAAE